MPKKGADRTRKGRRNRTIGPSSNNGSTPNATTVKATTSSPQQTRGRKTKNSSVGRNNLPKSSSAVPGTHKKSSSLNRNRKQRFNQSPNNPICFTSPEGELYKPGGKLFNLNILLHLHLISFTHYNLLNIYIL